MGASGSKAAQKTVRKFPSRAPGSSPATNPAARTTQRPAPAPSADAQPRSRPQASYTKDDAIRADSMDPGRPDFIGPEYAERLRQMGIAQPNPTYSPSSIASPFPDASGIKQSLATPRFPSSANNATLGVLEARRRLEARAKHELENTGKSTDQGREFLDIGTVKQILVLRQRGESASNIESRLGLKPGIVARLGPEGLVAPAS
ncbi:hypothetical protein C8A03DRAFT_29127 [Achaetomium macrosporum]|uniref:Helix-turn-helix domain-containing protein n=1 Tax=Achaetomium macrosporum TaxID=79813 RepID=A0AAN7CK10_9PEZI|nr:hypothetical protein C8A03DRAFT_29127 [Achaetomium macrosporum]